MWRGLFPALHLAFVCTEDELGRRLGYRYSRAVNIVAIEGVVQNYAWGSRTAIAELQGRSPSGDPEAELWLGTHGRGAARLCEPQDDATSLAQLLGQQLPFLFKVLAAESPLSLQAHPSREQAESGFADEEARGVFIDAPHRNYKDRNHKPELICALSPFAALSGFRPPADSARLIAALGCEPHVPQVCELLRAGDLESAFSRVLQVESTVLQKAIGQIRDRLSRDPLPAEASALAPWIARICDLYPGDPGVLAALLLNLVQLRPEQAMYLPAGNLHAYLGGVGLEIMASSDNVLRGGLTPKHVDRKELCRVLDFSPFAPSIIDGDVEKPSPGVTVRTYSTPAPEFELSVLDFEADATCPIDGPSIAFVLEGRVSAPDELLVLERGQAAFVFEGSSVSLRGAGSVARATKGAS